MRKEKKGRRKNKGGKRENSIELQKPNVEAEVYNNKQKMWMNIRDYIHTQKQNQSSPTKIKYNRPIYWPGEQRKPKIIYA